MKFVFINPELQLQSSVHYSGGHHALYCAARALAAAGHSVHLLYTSTKSQSLFRAMENGSMGNIAYSSAADGVAVWCSQGVIHHVSLSDAQPSTTKQLPAKCFNIPQASNLSIPALHLLQEATHLINTPQNSSSHSTLAQHSHTHPTPQPQHTARHRLQSNACWVVLDADSSHHPLSDSTSRNGSACCCLLEACCAAFLPSQLLMLVQNIHFLPIGPQGTAPRSETISQCWKNLGAVLCVSRFVAHYLTQHAAAVGMDPTRIHCVHHAAFEAFGPGPFQDYGAAAAQHLPWRPHQQQQELPLEPNHIPNSSSKCRQQQQQCTTAGACPSPPVIGCLKLTPEKGAAVVLRLAQHLPELAFLVVCADPDLQAAAAQLHNVRVVPPGEVDVLLRQVTVLLCPSVWQEAYGMVATEAVLRGVPVIVSDQGGLQEAALGCAAAVVPVQPMEFPPQCEDGSPGFGPCWKTRVLPRKQDVTGWVYALRALLADRARYESCSRAGREAGLQLLQQQRSLIDELVTWLQGRVCEGPTGGDGLGSSHGEKQRDR